MKNPSYNFLILLALFVFISSMLPIYTAHAQTAAQVAASQAAAAAVQAQNAASAATALYQAHPTNTQTAAAAAAAQAAAAAAETSAAQAFNSAGEPGPAQQEANAAAAASAAAQSISRGASTVANGVVPTTANTAAGTGSNFTPLTALPGVSTFAGSTNFVALFNNLYKICIGLGAMLALLEIIWAGVIWMTAGDSSEKVSQATKKIQNAVFGLLLVLSPVIVFGIINPNVLSLNLNVSSLAPNQGNAAGSGTAAGTAAGSALNNGATDGTATVGQSCEDNAQACGSGLVCSSQPTGTDTCVSSTGFAGRVKCDTGDVAAGSSCAACPDGSNAATLAQCPNTDGNGAPNDASLGAGDDCEQNANACGSGFVCQANPNGDDTCVATANLTGQVACDDGSFAASASACPQDSSSGGSSDNSDDSVPF